MHVPFATLKLVSVYASAALCGWAIGSLTAGAMLAVVYFSRHERGTAARPVLILLFKLVAALLIAVVFGLSFGFIMSMDRESYSLAAVYFLSAIAALAIAALLWQKATPELLARLKRVYAEFQRDA